MKKVMEIIQTASIKSINDNRNKMEKKENLSEEKTEKNDDVKKR
jgi:hypothetical protein